MPKRVPSAPVWSRGHAGRDRRIIALDDLYLLGLGPRTGQALRDLVEGLHPELSR